MLNVSLKWRLFAFFCILGFLPQVLISYYSINAHTLSLEKDCNDKVSQLLEQAAVQTDTRFQYLANELAGLAAQSFIQLAFQQYPQEQRLRLIKERMTMFCHPASAFVRLSLCYLDGKQLVGTDQGRLKNVLSEFERRAIARSGSRLNSHTLFTKGNQRQLAFLKPVTSYRQPGRIVGVLVGYVPVNELTVFLDRIDLGQNTQKIIFTDTGYRIDVSKPGGRHPSESKLINYTSILTNLKWRIEIRIEENELLAEVLTLKNKNIIFIISIILMALAASFGLSRRFIRPFHQIIDGTRIFAATNPSYRITVQTGYEAKQLAIAFNHMADQITERQDELNRASRLAALGVMTAGIAHEIKNPLTAIKSCAQVIERICADTAPPPHGGKRLTVSHDDLQEISGFSKDISTEVDRLNKIVNNFLDFAKPKPASRVNVKLSDIANRAIALVQWEFNKKRIRMQSAILPQTVCVDPDQLLQVLVNLLLNALQAAASGEGLVKMSSSHTPDGDFVLSVADNGVGIAEDKVQHIFDPFFSLRENGAGLGLSVVYNLLRLNDADISVQSRHGKGTTFEITFRRSIKDVADDGNSHIG